MENLDYVPCQTGYYGIVTSSTAGTKPAGLGGNRWMIFGMSSGNPMTWGVQVAIGFGESKIAIRNAPFTASGASWNNWIYK